MEERYFIRVDISGKTKYWDHTVGLHSGHSKRNGYQVFNSKRDALKKMKLLRRAFADWFKWEILPENEIPFIKKQIVKTKQTINQKQKTK